MRTFRRLAAAPLFSAFAVATLALGIGGTAALYAVAEAVLFRPIAIQDAERVVNVYHHDPSRVTAYHQTALSLPDADELRHGASTLADVMLWSRFSAPLSGQGAFTPLVGELVSGNYFTFVGAQPLLGRALQPADDLPGAPAVVDGVPDGLHDPVQALRLSQLRLESRSLEGGQRRLQRGRGTAP